jgi:hypothetical protein
MKTRLILLSAVVFSACPTNPPLDCAAKCEAVTVPPSICVDANTVRDFALGLGDCSQACSFVPLERPCPGGCDRGRCVENLTLADAGTTNDAGLTDAGSTDGGVNLCMNVTCASPPASACLDATKLRVFDARGVCSSGQCLYGSREEVCSSGCANGSCQNNPCQGITCSTPPASVCTDASTLQSSAPNGTCTNGGCRYAQTLTTCQFGCANGQCTNDPCVGVSCAQPPAPFCSTATTLRTFTTQGVCASGSCLYTPSDTTCRFGCVAGRCTNDPCQGVTCTQPPASACLNGGTLRTFTAAGVCSGGSCLYSPSDSTCQFGCAQGACVGNPCQGVTCNSPPASTCVNASTRRTFSTNGTCSGGACSYALTDTACQFGCLNGACVGNPCQGVTCNLAPASTCVGANTLRTFSAAGTCSNGACSYTAQETTCAFGCANGACTGNPCQGVTCNLPPASTCVTPTTLRSFSPSGTCAGGSCSYTAAESTCSFGCANGACTGNPCQGVTCNRPPASTCLNTTTLRSFSSSGTCAGGACSYAPSDSTCPFGCANGACVNDPCTGVTCNMPPARACLNPTTLRSFSSSGSCSGGGCSYAPSDTMCAFGCSSGACQNDPCAGVTCTTPPATTCVGNAVRTFSSAGTCTNGTCSFSFTDAPCAGGCSNGACVAPTCGGSTCNAPPAPTCLNANRLRTAFPVGTCNNNTCSYTQYELLCSQGCINGACIAGSWTLEFMSQANPPLFASADTIFDAAGEPIQVGCEVENSLSSLSNGTVRYRRRTTSGWQEETIDVGMGRGCQARVVLDSSGEPIAAWYDWVNNDLRFARRSGGTWAPKELISTNGGRGLAMALGPSGQPWVSYGGSTVQLGTRAADGTWASEQVFAGESTMTSLRIAGGAPWVLAESNRSVATKTGSTWSYVPFSMRPATFFTMSIKPDSFNVMAGVARAMVNDGSGWVWRSLIDGKLYNEPFLEEPIAIRATELPAAWVNRPVSGGGATAMVRVRQNEVWPENLTAIPYSFQLNRVVSYTGENGRHVVMDAVGARLTSPSVCAPMCTNRTCGSDGCGGVCGTCSSGFCAPTGVCSPLRAQLLDGVLPETAALRAGATSVHVVESTGGTLAHRTMGTGGIFSSATTAPASIGGLQRLDVVDDQPYTFRGGITAVAPFIRSTSGTWSTGPTLNTTSSYTMRFDAAGNGYAIRCAGASVLQLKLPVGATAWTPETIVATVQRDASCLSLEVTPAGYVFVVATTAGSSRQLVSNAPGFTTTVIPPSSSGVIRMAGDPSGDLHIMSAPNYVVWRAATNTLETETGPPGSDPRFLVTVDRVGAPAVAFIRNDMLVVARRTAPNVWALEELPVSGPPSNSFIPEVLGLAFDAANIPHLLLKDRAAWRHVTK